MKPRCWKVASGADRDAWLEARRKIITASEAGSISGTNPFKTKAQLWHDKKHGTKYEDTIHTLRGKKFEPTVLKAWSEANNGAPYRQLSDLLVSVQYPFIGATLDGLGRTGGQSWILEAKAPAKPWGKKGCPKYYISQVVVQMLVSGIPRAVVIEGIGPDYTKCIQHKFYLTDYSQSQILEFVDKLKAFYLTLEMEWLPLDSF